MDPRKAAWNARQKDFQKSLKDPLKFEQAIELFTQQHAMLHDNRMSGAAAAVRAGLRSAPTFDDDAWEDVTEEAARLIPSGQEHSIAWIIWHMARIEDATMNVLVADGKQVFYREDWQKKLKTSFSMIGNSMTPEERLELSQQVDIQALRDYRIAVGRQTERVVKNLAPGGMKQITPPGRLRRLIDDKTVDEKFQGPLNYWGGLTVAGLLLMPPTRHLLMHLNEIMKLKKKVLKDCN